MYNSQACLRFLAGCSLSLLAGRIMERSDDPHKLASTHGLTVSDGGAPGEPAKDSCRFKEAEGVLPRFVEYLL